MTCSTCQAEGKKCAACEIADMGFVKKADIEQMLNQPSNVGGTTGTHPENIAINDILNHLNTCNNPQCKLHQIKNQIFNEGVQIGFTEGLAW